MSDAPGGPDWYQASDGKWYPSQPTQQPYGQATPTPPPSGGYQAPPAAPYQQPPTAPYQPYGQVPPRPPQNGMATAAMVLGIIALVTFWFCGVGALVGIGAIVFGVLGLSAAKKLPGQPLRGRAQAGLIMGIVAVALSALFVVGFLFLGRNSSSDLNTDPRDGVCNNSRFLQDPDC